MKLPTDCKNCNSENLEIRPGKAPHAAALVCADCAKWQRWLSKEIVRSLGIDLSALEAEVKS